MNFMTKYKMLWHNPTEEIKERVNTYCSTYQDYAEGFGYKNSHHRSNSQHMQQRFGLKHIQWLGQTHSAKVCQAPTSGYRKADACWTQIPHLACAAMTADCLPVFFTNSEATQVAVAHAGWRGLATGILQNTIASFNQKDKIYAAFGPAISQNNYEVGGDMIEYFPDQAFAFKLHKQSGKFYLSLYQLAGEILKQHGVTPPPIPDWCTYKDRANLPSYRREPNKSERIANLIWFR